MTLLTVVLPQTVSSPLRVGMGLLMVVILLGIALRVYVVVGLVFTRAIMGPSLATGLISLRWGHVLSTLVFLGWPILMVGALLWSLSLRVRTRR